MAKKGNVFVVGHQNPDSDSICSAIAYAELRCQQGLAGVSAARAGTINRQTQFILDHLAVKVPTLLPDVYPRIKDVVTETVISIHQNAPLSEALELYHQHHIRMLPVVDDDGCATGLLLLKQAAEHFLVPAEPEKLRRISASINSISKCLGATAQTIFAPDSVETFDLHVGARREVSFSRWVDEINPAKTILITGDRHGIQKIAVDAGIRLLIISGDSPVDPDILAIAKKNGVSILVSKYDTANCVWLTRMAIPVGLLADDDFIVVQPSDLLEDLRVKLTHGKRTGAIINSAAGKVVGLATQSHLIKDSPTQLILVDHNELSQAVPGANKVKIIEVIDHHRLANFHTDLPIKFINQPLGSTCSIVATLYQQAAIKPSKKIAGLMLAGLLSDTVIMKSPTTTIVDTQLIPWLEEYSGLDHQQFGAELFAAGSPMASGMPAKELVAADYKEYGVGDHLIGLGQVEVVNFHSFYVRQAELLQELQRIKVAKRLELAALLVTDIVKGNSLLLTAGSSELPYIIGYPQKETNLYQLSGVLSRKKQLVPHLLKVFKG